MATNTIRHVSDESQYKIFNPQGTAFPSNIVNVQAALAALSPQAVNGVPNATQAVIGISRFATQAEVDAGSLTNVGVSPLTLKSAILRPPASTTVAGLTRYATTAEATAGTVSNAAVVPTGLKAAIDAANTYVLTRQATESSFGVAKISTIVAAEAGTDDLTIMTPKKVARAIAKATSALPTYSTASESAEGIIRLATAGQVQSGTAGALAVTPAGLKTLTSTAARAGLILLASAAEVSAGTNATKAITPATLLSRNGNESRLGLLKTTRTVGSGDASTALAYNANVISTSGNQSISGGLTITGLTVNGNGSISGSLNVVGNLTKSGKQVVTVDMIGDDVPVGVIMMWASSAALPAKWRDCDGWTGYTSSSHPDLWRVHPGGIPDMRGLFVRGVGAGSHIAAQQGTDSKGKERLGVGCSGGAVGTVQAQGVRYHKHESGWGEHHQRNEARNGCTVRNGFVGSNKTDYDNYKWFTNDGSEVEAENIRDSFGTMNSDGLIGKENRPWNMSVRYIIKIQ